MPKMIIEEKSDALVSAERLAVSAANNLTSVPPTQCPVDLTRSIARLYLSQSCGKCTPCRVGLSTCVNILDGILAGEGEVKDLSTLIETAQVVYAASDCAIGFTAGSMLMDALNGFAADFESHVQDDACIHHAKTQAPCVTTCPAHVNVPAYIACIREGRFDDALRVIRNNNPFPTVCGYVCEHPCEFTCRRTLQDAPVNICGLKRYAADNAQWSPAPTPLPSTGKTIGIIGGGPCGLTAAYYLQLMGHQVTIYDQRERLGGMVRYGIPDYRLPQSRLDADIDFILSTGVQVRENCAIGTDITADEVLESHDATYIAIGAHAGKSLGLEGEDAAGVMSAVEFLRDTALGKAPNFTGKRVCVVGGGNVAMDCTRTAKRLGAAVVECVYRRRITDMTALPEEISEAQAEGCQITPLQAPIALETDEQGNVCALITQPQIIGSIGKNGRPTPYAADVAPRRIETDVVIVAIGQAIDMDAFAKIVETHRGSIVAREDGVIADSPSLLFAGGDAVSGPATVIKAIAAGKVAAHNIDAALGFTHDVYDPVEVPPATPAIEPCGRIDLKDIIFAEAAQTFELAKLGMSTEEAHQEASRCLRCDHYGLAATVSQEVTTW